MTFKYQTLKNEIEQAIALGLYNEKLPSIRGYASEKNVSISTIQKVFSTLELEGKIYAKPQKGYFINQTVNQEISPYGVAVEQIYTEAELEQQVLGSLNDHSVIPLSSTAPSSIINNEHLLNKHHKKAFNKKTYRFDFIDEVQGSVELRRAISQHLYKQGCIAEPSCIHITSGRKEGLLVALLATKSLGAKVAIESPSSFYFQSSVKRLCKEVIEIPIQNDYQFELQLLNEAWLQHKFTTYLVNPNFNDPTGRVLTNEDKTNLIKWAKSKEITLIEYDRGELYFGIERPLSLAALAKNIAGAKVISIQDFFDTVSTRINLGFLIATDLNNEIHYAKHTVTEEPNLHIQHVICSLIVSGDYQQLLNKLRKQLHNNYIETQKILKTYLPSNITYSPQVGGPCIWMKINANYSSTDLWKKLVDQGIAIAPGTMFSFNEKFEQYFRITFALPWNTQLSMGLKTVCHALEKLSQAEE